MQLARSPGPAFRAARLAGSIALGLVLVAVATLGMLVLAVQATRR